MLRFRKMIFGCLAALLCGDISVAAPEVAPLGPNPILRDRFTADPAPLTVGDRLYLYVGHDEGRDGFNMNDWLVYSTKDMRHWTPHPVLMRPTDFAWAKGEAWASQMVHKGGRWWFYITAEHKPPLNGKAIGVAECAGPIGPCHDARGSALITDNKATWRTWSDIDPTVFTDKDGTSWIAWGNSNLYLAKLKPNMIELDGPPRELHLTNYLEGPWLYERKGLYYLVYASIKEPEQKAERISYATAPSVEGPWTYRGELTGPAQNSFTIHPGIEQFHGRTYFFYHNGTLTLDGQQGSQYRRSVAVEELHYNPDGTIKPIVQRPPRIE